MKEEKKLKNYFHVRLYDSEVVKSIDEILATGKFDSANELLGIAIAYGIEKIYVDFGKRKMLANNMPDAELPESERLVKIEQVLHNVKVMLEDIFIMQNCHEALISTIYNVEKFDFAGEGESVSADLMDSGYYAGLPKFFADIKETLAARFSRKMNQIKK